MFLPSFSVLLFIQPPYPFDVIEGRRVRALLFSVYAKRRSRGERVHGHKGISRGRRVKQKGVQAAVG
jgi:hypothetical protein